MIFYLVTTGSIFDISLLCEIFYISLLCERFVRIQSINQNVSQDRTGLSGYYVQFDKYVHTDRTMLFVCIIIRIILDVRLVDVPAGVTLKEGHKGFLRLPSAVLALFFIARRIQPSLSLVDREVDFVYPRINRSDSPLTC